MTYDLRRTFGARLRLLRSELGISQSDMGDLCGVHRTRIGHLERGRVNVTLRTVEKVAEVFGTDPLELLQPLPGAEREQDVRPR